MEATRLSKSSFGGQLLAELRDLNHSKQQPTSAAKQPPGRSFMEHLETSIKDVNSHQKLADKAATDLATGKSQNIHETMLASSQAEITFNLMVQVRNKALEAYQEIMRMPV